MLAIFILPGIRHGLWRPDESRVAAISAAMANTGDYLVPQLNGYPFLEHPPLYYACGGLVARLLGTGWDLPYRLVSLLFSLLSIWLVYRLMAGRINVRAGLLAAGVLASTGVFFRISRWIQVDSALVCMVVLAMYASMRAESIRSWREPILLGLAIALAFLVKGPVGPAMIMAALALEALRRRSPLLRLWPALLVALLVTIPWILALYARGGWDFLDLLLITNNFKRFSGSADLALLGHNEGPFFYVTALPKALLPWTLILIPALVAACKNWRHNDYLSWVIGPLALLLVAASKRDVYLAPLTPAFACLLADWWLNSAKAPWENVLLKLTGTLAALSCLAPILIGPYLHLGSWGLALGAIGLLACLSAAGQLKRAQPETQSLAVVGLMLTGLALSAALTIEAARPKEDLLPVARQILAMAGPQPLTILGFEEATRGVFYVAAGRQVANLPQPFVVTRRGLYVWMDTHDAVTELVRQQGHVTVLLDRPVGNRELHLAQVVPNQMGQL